MAAVLRDHQRPALVVWGRHDPSLPVAQACRQRDTVPAARLAILERRERALAVRGRPGGVLAAVVPFLREVTARQQPGPVVPDAPEPAPV